MKQTISDIDPALVNHIQELRERLKENPGAQAQLWLLLPGALVTGNIAAEEEGLEQGFLKFENAKVHVAGIEEKPKAAIRIRLSDVIAWGPESRSSVPVLAQARARRRR